MDCKTVAVRKAFVLSKDAETGTRTLKHHQSRSTNGCRCHLSNIQKSCDGELTNTKTHHHTSNNYNSLVVGIRNLSDAAEEDADRGDPEDHLAAPAIVDGRCNQSTKQVPNVNGRSGQRLERRGQLLIAIRIKGGSIVVLESLHGQHTIVVGVIVTIAKSTDRGNGAEEDSPLVGLPVKLHGV